MGYRSDDKPKPQRKRRKRRARAKGKRLALDLTNEMEKNYERTSTEYEHRPEVRRLGQPPKTEDPSRKG